MKTWLIKMMIGAPLNFEQVRTYVLTRIHNDKQKPYAQGLYEQTNCLSVEHELNVLRKISKYFSLKKRPEPGEPIRILPKFIGTNFVLKSKLPK